AAQVLGLPGERWPAGGSTEPGLIVAYDLSTVDETVARPGVLQPPGPVLWGHASRWASAAPFAAGPTTHPSHRNLSPRGARLRVNPDTKQAERQPSDTRPAPDRATDIVAAELQAEALRDVPALVDLAQAARVATGETGLGAFRTEGPRHRQPVGSPVPSNRFL